MKNKLLHFVIILSLLVSDFSIMTVIAEKVKCGTDGRSKNNNLCIRNKVVEKYNRIESLKGEILTKLGLPVAPNITNPRTISENMLDELTSLQSANKPSSPYYALPITTHHVKSTRHKIGRSHTNPNKTNIYAYSYLVFNLTIQRKHQHIYKANLRFHLGKELNLFASSRAKTQSLLLYLEQSEKRKTLLLKKKIDPGANSQNLDMTKLFQYLVKKQVKSTQGPVDVNLRLRIVVLRNNKKISRIIDESKEKARIVIQSYDQRDVEAKRSRRAVTTNFCSNPNVKVCCVRPLTINFREDLGWDFIASPPAFNANYCSGTCPHNWQSENPQLHDILYRYSTRNNKSIGPCCVPNEYESLTILYFNENNEPTYVKLPNVIVRSCSCR